MAFSKLLLFLFLVTLSISQGIYCITSSSSLIRNEEASASENNGCNHLLDELKSTVSALQSIIVEMKKDLLSKEERIRGLELFIRDKSYLFESEIDSSQFESPVEHETEEEEKIYQLQKQEVEFHRKTRLQVENRADKNVAQLITKLQSIDGKWLSSKLGLNSNKTQAYLMTLWHLHLSPALHSTLQKVSWKIDQIQKWSEPHIENLNSNWIPSIKDACVTLTIYLEPKVQYLTNKSIEVIYMSKQAVTPYLIQGFDISSYCLEVVRTHSHPYTNHIMSIAKPHLENVLAALEPYTENVRYGFKKLMDSTTIYHQQAQEMLKNNEVTKPIATMDLAWVGATALIGFPLIFIIKLLSAVSNPKKKKRYNHNKEPTNGYRRAKRRHPH